MAKIFGASSRGKIVAQARSAGLNIAQVEFLEENDLISLAQQSWVRTRYILNLLGDEPQLAITALQSKLGVEEIDEMFNSGQLSEEALGVMNVLDEGSEGNEFAKKPSFKDRLRKKTL